jgi:hypothetical protein
LIAPNGKLQPSTADRGMPCSYLLVATFRGIAYRAVKHSKTGVNVNRHKWVRSLPRSIVVLDAEIELISGALLLPTCERDLVSVAKQGGTLSESTTISISGN